MCSLQSNPPCCTELYDLPRKVEVIDRRNSGTYSERAHQPNEVDKIWWYCKENFTSSTQKRKFWNTFLKPVWEEYQQLKRHNQLYFAFWHEDASFPFVLGMQTRCFPVINYTCLISQLYNFLPGELGAKVWHFIFATSKKIHKKLIKG